MEIQRFEFDRNDSYLFEYSFKHGAIFLHCTVYSWKPSVLKRMYNTFAEFTDAAIRMGFDKVYSVTPNIKFTELFNSEKIGEIHDKEERYEVVQWVLK